MRVLSALMFTVVGRVPTNRFVEQLHRSRVPVPSMDSPRPKTGRRMSAPQMRGARRPSLRTKSPPVGRTGHQRRRAGASEDAVRDPATHHAGPKKRGQQPNRDDALRTVRRSRNETLARPRGTAARTTKAPGPEACSAPATQTRERRTQLHGHQSEKGRANRRWRPPIAALAIGGRHDQRLRRRQRADVADGAERDRRQRRKQRRNPRRGNGEQRHAHRKQQRRRW